MSACDVYRIYLRMDQKKAGMRSYLHRTDRRCDCGAISYCRPKSQGGDARRSQKDTGRQPASHPPHLPKRDILSYRSDAVRRARDQQGAVDRG